MKAQPVPRDFILGGWGGEVALVRLRPDTLQLVCRDQGPEKRFHADVSPNLWDLTES